MSGNEVAPGLLYDYAASLNVDRAASARGFSETHLMGQAALASALLILERLEEAPSDSPKVLWILCGTGNNGGDGLALAYMLLGSGRVSREQIRVFLCGPMRSEASRFYQEQLRMSGIEGQTSVSFHAKLPGDGDLLVEALLGTGQSGPPRAEIGRLLAEIARTKTRAHPPHHVALDVPAGLTENARASFAGGRSDASAFSLPLPDEVHSYGTRKLALHLDERIAAHTSVRQLPIGFHPGDLKTLAPPFALLHDSQSIHDLREFFHKKATDHKYNAGHGLLLGGSEGTEGAFLLAARSFFAAGGGVLSSVVPASSRGGLLQSEPSVMFKTSLDQLDKMPSAIAIGPGLSKADLEHVSGSLFAYLEKWAGPGSGGCIILDAAATAWALDPRYPAAARARTLITPHGGEWKKLGGPEIDCVDGLKKAMEWNKKTTGTSAYVKGSVSVLLSPDFCFVHSRPNPSLAVAGSGDCLAGVLLASAARSTHSSLAIKDIAGFSVALLDDAARTMTHPASSDFPGRIRAILGGGSRGDENHNEDMFLAAPRRAAPEKGR